MSAERLATFVVAALTLGLIGCGKSDTSVTASSETPAPPASNTATNSASDHPATVNLELTDRVGQTRVPVDQLLDISTAKPDAGATFGDPVVSDPATLTFQKSVPGKVGPAWEFKAMKPGSVTVTIPYSNNGKPDTSKDILVTVLVGS